MLKQVRSERAPGAALALALLLLLALLAVRPTAASAWEPTIDQGTPLRVMTRNLYLGADLNRILAAQSPEEIVLLTTQTFQVVQATHFQARAGRIAAEIQDAKPHLVGLQEATRYEITIPLPGGGVQQVVIDHLDILLAHLAGEYEEAARVRNADVALPAVVGFNPADGSPIVGSIRLIDRDVILQRIDPDVTTFDAEGQNFQVNLEVPVGPATVEFTRGFVAVTARVGGRDYRVVNTHLEVYIPGPASQVPLAQAQELALVLAGEELPVVLLGDLNSAPFDPSGAPYAVLLAAGFADVWTHHRPWSRPGPTCCQTETLTNPESTLSERIDHILVRNTMFRLPFSVLGRTHVSLVGHEPLAPPIPSELGGAPITLHWASDHAGVVAELRLPALSSQ